MAIANALAFLLYLITSVILIRRFTQKGSSSTNNVPVALLAILALLFQATDIFFTMKAAGGWSLGLFTTLSIISWLMVLIALIAGQSQPSAHPGIIVYPLAALCVLLKTGIPSPAPPSLPEPGLEWHVLLAMSAYSFFMLATAQALVLWIQEKQIRQRHLAGFIRKLPPLQTMEKTLFQLILTGFILLTLGLITGFMFVDNLFAQHLVHKTILSLIAWCLFATLLWGRWRKGWRGKTAVEWTLLGSTFLFLAYIGSEFVLQYVTQK